ncbi:MAG: hypothetical protein WD176_09720, partial [Pirellulales bacterium]
QPQVRRYAMLAVVVLFLTAIVLAVCLVFIGMFLDVGVLRPAPQSIHTSAARPLPLLEGRSLRRWAEDWAASLVARKLKQSPSPAAIVAVTAEIESNVTDMLRWAHVETVTDPSVPCRRGQDAIAVTTPELLAITSDLSRTKSQQVVEAIQERARTNVERRAAKQPADGAEAPSCPLLDAEGRCAAFASRPLHCRTHCPACVAIGESPAAARFADDPFAIALGEGVNRGLARGLSAAGLDHQTYDLNSALAVALKQPTAAVRFARGEMVLAGCKTS